MMQLVLFAIVVVIIFYVAIIYTNEALILLAFSTMLLGFVAYLYLVILRFLVDTSINAPITVTDAHKTLTIRLAVKKRLWFPVERMNVCVLVENELDAQKRTKWFELTNVQAGSSEYPLSLTIDAAGNYRIRIKKIKLYDLTGLFYLKFRVQHLFAKKRQKSEQICVMPKLQETGVVLTEPVKKFFGDADVYDPNTAGTDHSEIFQVREYRAGDKMPSIHWKLSAKMDDLIVREDSQPKACPVVLLLDDRREKSKQEFGEFLEIAAGLSFSIMDRGCAHYVVWEDDENEGEAGLRSMRVDDEESFYSFLYEYMKSLKKNNARKTKSDLRICYDEIFRAENYVYLLELSRDLRLTKYTYNVTTPQILCIYTGGEHLRQMEEMEIVL